MTQSNDCVAIKSRTYSQIVREEIAMITVQNYFFVSTHPFILRWDPLDAMLYSEVRHVLVVLIMPPNTVSRRRK